MNQSCAIWSNGVYHIVHVPDYDGPWRSLCGAHTFTTLETKTPGSPPCEDCLLEAGRIIGMAACLVPLASRLENHPLRIKTEKP